MKTGNIKVLINIKLVNLPDSVVEPITRYISNIRQNLSNEKNEFYIAWVSSSTLGVDFLNDARKAVLYMLYSDTFPRFLQKDVNALQKDVNAPIIKSSNF